MLDRIPQFPEFREVGIDLAPEVGAFLRSLEPPIAELTFANLYLFRAAHRYRLSRLGGLLLVTGQGYNGKPYALPPLGAGDVAGAALRVCELLAAQGAEPELFPVPTEWVALHFSGETWSAASDRDQADYVYLREELATLPGKKFHKRNNRLQKFLREEAGGYAFAPLGREHVDACRQLASGWCEIRCSVERPSTYLETAAVLDALEHRGELGLRGGVILLGGKVAAFCLGEPLSADTFVVHFEKAEAGREGLAQLINRDFCLKELGAYTYVNREQDLGDPGLRQAKEAYHPVRLVEKHRVRPVRLPPLQGSEGLA